jgi:hypothetical protein
VWHVCGEFLERGPTATVDIPPYWLERGKAIPEIAALGPTFAASAQRYRQIHRCGRHG